MTDAPRKRRWPKVLAVLAALALLAAWWVDRQLEPVRLANTVLSAVGKSQGLELSFSGTPDYSLRPEPRLRIPNLVARQPGGAAPMLTAREIEVSLPWATVWGDGPVVITRIALQSPALDMAALNDWLDGRPDSGETELPTLTDGVSIRDGRLTARDWRVESLSLALPKLAPGQPASIDASGRFLQATREISFAAQLEAGTAGLDTALRLNSAGQLRDETLDLPWSLALDGRLEASGERLRLIAERIEWKARSPLPDFSGAGELTSGESLALELQGELPNWPEAWPTLPEPMVSSQAPLALTLGYTGASDLTGPLQLLLRRDETTLEAGFAPSELMAWLEAGEANPLPPLVGELRTPSMVVEGVELEGVRIRIEEEPPSTDPGPSGEP